MDMTTIGVYDSGIGGLTTAKILLNRFAGNDLFYFADNLNHPFGNKDEDSLKETVRKGIAHVKAHSDIVVLACNTASSVTEEKDVIKLLPPIGDFCEDAENTLIMATNRTLCKISDIKSDDASQNKSAFLRDFKKADTSELATLVEIQASLQSRKGNLDMTELLPYFAERIFSFKGVKNVILGCSHYLYCKPQISKILGAVNYFDGNEYLCRELETQISAHPQSPAKITFGFTSQNEEKKYDRILKILMNTD